MAGTKDPVQGNFFSITIDGATKPLAFFTAVSGLNVEFEVVEHKLNTDTGQTIIQKIPGRTKYSEVVLKRGFTQDLELYSWFDMVLKGKIAEARRTAAIVVYDQLMAPIAQFKLLRVWPSKISASDLSAGSDDVIVEEVTLQHELLEWA